MRNSSEIPMLEPRFGPAQWSDPVPHQDCAADFAAQSYGEPIHVGEFCIEIVTEVGQSDCAEATWAAGVFDNPCLIEISGRAGRMQAGALAECDAVLVCGNDLQSVKALIDEVRCYAPGAAVFTVSRRLPPAKRALALGWGADDVLDTDMDRREAAARIRGACQRIALAKRRAG